MDMHLNTKCSLMHMALSIFGCVIQDGCQFWGSLKNRTDDVPVIKNNHSKEKKIQRRVKTNLAPGVVFWWLGRCSGLKEQRTTEIHQNDLGGLQQTTRAKRDSNKPLSLRGL